MKLLLWTVQLQSLHPYSSTSFNALDVCIHAGHRPAWQWSTLTT